jgi:hypothetical protein
MDNFIVYVILSLVLGALVWTMGRYVWKLHSNPSIAFNHAYLLTMLFSMVAVVALIPLAASIVLHSLSLFPSGIWFAVAAAFAAGFTVNVIVNWPITYLINKIETYEIKLKTLSSQAIPTATLTDTKSKINIHAVIEALVIIGLIIALVTSGVFAVVSYSTNISGNGNIASMPGVAVFSDAQGQYPLTNINWGTLAPGSSVPQIIFLKNTGNMPETFALSITFSPSTVSTYLTLTWNYNSSAVQAGSIIQVTLTLTVASNAPSTSFSGSITISGTG